MLEDYRPQLEGLKYSAKLFAKSLPMEPPSFMNSHPDENALLYCLINASI